MPTWKCRLDDASLERLRGEFQLQQISNEVLVPGEEHLPPGHVRQVAVDSLLLLVRQENPGVERERLYTLMNELHLVCEPVADG